MSMRLLKFKDAIREAQEIVLCSDEKAFLIGEGVPDPKAVFGTTAGLKDKFGSQVFDMPVSENGVTGICIGAAISGLKPILVHMRIDFALYSIDQIVNNAAKISSMFGGVHNCQMVIRCLVGRGWGQGNQHSQNLTSMFAHVPGLKVVVPSNALDAKLLLLASHHDPNPVIFIEHRWLYETTSNVPEGFLQFPKLDEVSLNQISHGEDCTIVASGYSVMEMMLAEQELRKNGVECDTFALQVVKPLNLRQVLWSVRKTGRLLVLDDAWPTCGLSAEIIAQISEAGVDFKSAPARLTYPEYPSGSSPELTKHYYPGPWNICLAVKNLVGKNIDLDSILKYQRHRTHDVPDASFRGPF